MRGGSPVRLDISGISLSRLGSVENTAGIGYKVRYIDSREKQRTMMKGGKGHPLPRNLPGFTIFWLVEDVPVTPNH